MTERPIDGIVVVRPDKRTSLGRTRGSPRKERREMTSIPMTAGWQRRRLVNQAMDAHAGWRDQCRAVRLAYSYWAGASEGDAGAWYNAYSAALDREQRAAERYAGLIERLGDIVAADLDPMPGVAVAASQQS
jgi:hypothetical protein